MNNNVIPILCREDLYLIVPSLYLPNDNMINSLSMTFLKTVSHFLLVMTDQHRLCFDEIFTRYDNALSECSGCYNHSLLMMTIHTQY